MGWGEGVVWGLAGTLVLSLALNLTLIVFPRAREVSLSLARGLLVRLRTSLRLPTSPPLPTPAVANATPATEGGYEMPNFWAPQPPLPIRAPRVRANNGLRTPTITRAAMAAATAAALANPNPTPTEPPFRTGNLFLYQNNP